MHLFGLQTRNVTNISWKGFRGVSLTIVFPVLGTQDFLMIPGSRFLIFPPLFPTLDYLRTMFVVGCLWGKYDISWEDYIKVNTSNSRQAVNVDFRHFRSRTDAFHNSLFVSFPRIWSTLPDDVSSEIVLNLFSVFAQFASMCVHLSLIVFIFYCVSLVFGDSLNSDLVRFLGIRQGPRCLLLILFLPFSLMICNCILSNLCTWTMNKSNQIKSNIQITCTYWVCI